MANDGFPEQPAIGPDHEATLTYKQLERILIEFFMDYNASSTNSRKANIERPIQKIREQLLRDLPGTGVVRRKRR